MSLRRSAAVPPSPAQDARHRVLERAYPLAKHLAEVLELEAIEPHATSVKHVRQAIGAELAENYYSELLVGDPQCHATSGSPNADDGSSSSAADERTDPLDPAEEAALLRQALRREEEGPEVDDDR